MILQFHARGKKITGLSVKTVGFRRFFSFVFFFFFFSLCTLVIHPVKYHGTKYVSRRFILRRGVTVRSEVASHLLSVRTRSFAIRVTPNRLLRFLKKKKAKKKKKQRSINRESFPWKRRETDKIKDKQRNSKSKPNCVHAHG